MSRLQNLIISNSVLKRINRCKDSLCPCCHESAGILWSVSTQIIWDATYLWTGEQKCVVLSFLSLLNAPYPRRNSNWHFTYYFCTGFLLLYSIRKLCLQSAATFKASDFLKRLPVIFVMIFEIPHYLFWKPDSCRYIFSKRHEPNKLPSLVFCTNIVNSFICFITLSLSPCQPFPRLCALPQVPVIFCALPPPPASTIGLFLWAVFLQFTECRGTQIWVCSHPFQGWSIIIYWPMPTTPP